MRIKSGVTDQYIYFVGVKRSDHVTRDTGPTDTGTNVAAFDVSYSRNGGTPTHFSTPTAQSVDTGFLGTGGGDTGWKTGLTYKLLLDEGTTLSAGNVTEELVIMITDTGATMDPVTRVIELFRSDTGQIADAIFAKGIESFIHDTGVADTVWKYSTSGAAGDTGSTAYAQGRLMAVRGDTGAAHLDAGRLGTSAPAASLDTGATKDAVWGTAAGTDGPGAIGSILDTGIADAVWVHTVNPRVLTAFIHDTGISDTVWKETVRTVTAFEHDTGVADTVWKYSARALTAFSHDTGIADTVWKSSSSGFTGDTGSVGYAQGRLMAVHGDTGAAHIDQGRLGVVADSGKMSAVLDTGKVASAIWSSHATRVLTAFIHDTGVANAVWKESTSTFTGDTGSVAYAQGRLMAAHADTGAVHLVSGRLAATDSGIVAAVLDTGKVNIAVWDTLRAAHTVSGSFGRDLADSGKVAAVLDTGKVGGVLDTGKVANAIWNSLQSDHTTASTFGRNVADSGKIAAVLDTGKASVAIWGSLKSAHGDTGSFGEEIAGGVNVEQLVGDTGAAKRLQQFAGVKLTDSGTLDTGTITVTAVIDTGEVSNAVWNSLKASHGDTGTFGEEVASGLSLEKIAGDTGAASHLKDAFADTGNRPKVNVTQWGDSGVQVPNQGGVPAVDVERIDGDTGAADILGKFAEVKLSVTGAFDTGTLEGTQAGTIDANITYVNETKVKGTGSGGSEWGPE